MMNLEILSKVLNIPLESMERAVALQSGNPETSRNRLLTTFGNVHRNQQLDCHDTVSRFPRLKRMK